MADALDELVREVASDPSSVGLVLHGSRATGNARPDSDYDLIRVVDDDVYERRRTDGTLQERRTLEDGLHADVLYQSPRRLEWLAANPGWWTPTYTTARIIIDKDGAVGRLVDAIVVRAGDVAFDSVAEMYDSYLNSFVRSLKSWRRRDELGGRVHASQSALYLLPTLFGLERMWMPYFDALDAKLGELEVAQEWEPGFLRLAVLELLTTGDPTFQQQLERRVEALLTSRGFVHKWGGDLEPLKALSF